MMGMQDLASTEQERPAVDSKIIPVIREAITMVQMVFFQQVKGQLQQADAKRSPEEHTLLAGAIVNNLFGTEPVDPAVSVYGAEHREEVEEQLRAITEWGTTFLPFLTDALRMKTICDHQEGIHSIPSLLMAKALGILQEERALPMPSTFMLSVRQLANQHGLVEALSVSPSPETPE